MKSRMMVGKRAIKRTTSMSGFSFDDLTIHAVDHDDDDDDNDDEIMSMISTRPRRSSVNRRSSADFAAHISHSSLFLSTCSLCNRRLPPGRDIYMYRGDGGYCSLECRQEQMIEDEKREKEKEKEKESSNSYNPSSNSHSSTPALAM